MSEHIHEWKIDWDCQRNEYCYCADETCDELLYPDDVEAMLNEYETLKTAVRNKMLQWMEEVSDD